MQGIFTALLTPFNADYTVNEKSLQKLVEFNLEKGVNGFYVGGSTSEGMLMSPEERKEVFRQKSCGRQGRYDSALRLGLHRRRDKHGKGG